MDEEQKNFLRHAANNLKVDTMIQEVLGGIQIEMMLPTNPVTGVYKKT